MTASSPEFDAGSSSFARSPDAAPPTLLVVDDDPAIRRILAAALQQAGYQILTAADGTVALEVLTRLAQDRRPLDAMLLDVHMPGISGTDLLDRMHQVGMVLPVIGVSGDLEDETVDELKRRGVCELIRKPVRLDVLVATVRDFLERTGGLAEHRRAGEPQSTDEVKVLDSAPGDATPTN